MRPEYGEKYEEKKVKSPMSNNIADNFDAVQRIAKGINDIELNPEKSQLGKDKNQNDCPDEMDEEENCNVDIDDEQEKSDYVDENFEIDETDELWGL
jgi:hypothetical protein